MVAALPLLAEIATKIVEKIAAIRMLDILFIDMSPPKIWLIRQLEPFRLIRPQ